MIKHYLQVEYVGSFVYAPCIGFAKLSVLSIFWTAFPARYLRRVVVVTAAFVTAWAIACCLVGLLACIPIHAVWDIELQASGQARCIHLVKYYYGLQIPNILSDVFILILPWSAVRDLSRGLPLRQRVALFGIFSLGIVTVIFDIIRLVVLVQTPTTPDFSWNQVPASIWTDIEPSIAILVACLPVMRPLLNLPTFLKRRDNTYNYDNQIYAAGTALSARQSNGVNEEYAMSPRSNDTSHRNTIIGRQEAFNANGKGPATGVGASHFDSD